MQTGIWRQSQTLSLKERKLFREEGEQMMEERKKAARGKLGGGGGRRRGMLWASIQHGQLFDVKLSSVILWLSFEVWKSVTKV